MTYLLIYGGVLVIDGRAFINISMHHNRTIVVYNVFDNSNGNDFVTYEKFFGTNSQAVEQGELAVAA